ncbi:uncharacterized protein [Haliotis asinina]|uniref:uncharacterized protein n=1 Tax=Haliotis asinina TaxID=109174 RepID=UPI003531CD51
MVWSRQRVACCLTSVIILVNVRQIDSRWKPGNHSFHVSCIRTDWVLAQSTCSKKQGTMFELDDLKQSYGLPILQSALRDIGEMWIRRERKGGCLKAVKLKNTTRMSSGEHGSYSEDDNVLQGTNCTELHHYVCKLPTPPEERRGANDSEPRYVPCQSHPKPSRSGYIYLTLLGVGLVLLLSSIATYISVRRLRGTDGRVTEGHPNAVESLSGTQPDNPDTCELQVPDGDGHPVVQTDLISMDTDDSAFLGETFDTYDDPAGLSDESEDHSGGKMDLTPSPPEDDALFISDTYDNVTYLSGK